MNKFKAKKKSKRKVKKLKYLIYLIIIYLSYNISLYASVNKNLFINKDDFIKIILSESNHNILYNYNSSDIASSIINMVSKIDLSNPTRILDKNLPRFFEYENGIILDYEHNDDYSNMEELSKITGYVNNPDPVINGKPLVYIYNSHQLENYAYNKVEPHSVVPNVMTASYMLREKLKSYGIEAIVEDTNFSDILRTNGWNHASSYRVSKMAMEGIKEKYSSIIYFIDIHRDSVNGNITKKTINNIDYARTLFVVGLDNKTYEPNLALAEELHKKINEKLPGLSRGVLTKKGAGVDGVYNQDISPNVILLEVGGVDNSINEVNEAIGAFALILSNYIHEEIS